MTTMAIGVGGMVGDNDDGDDGVGGTSVMDIGSVSDDGTDCDDIPLSLLASPSPSPTP